MFSPKEQDLIRSLSRPDARWHRIHTKKKQVVPWLGYFPPRFRQFVITVICANEVLRKRGEGRELSIDEVSEAIGIPVPNGMAGGRWPIVYPHLFWLECKQVWETIAHVPLEIQQCECGEVIQISPEGIGCPHCKARFDADRFHRRNDGSNGPDWGPNYILLLNQFPKVVRKLERAGGFIEIPPDSNIPCLVVSATVRYHRDFPILRGRSYDYSDNSEDRSSIITLYDPLVDELSGTMRSKHTLGGGHFCLWNETPPNMSALWCIMQCELWYLSWLNYNETGNWSNPEH